MFTLGSYLNKEMLIYFFLLLIILLFVSFDSLFTTKGILILISVIYCYYIFRLSIKSINFKMPNIFFGFWLLYATLQMFFIEYGYLTELHYQVLILGFILIWFMSNLINSTSKLEVVYKAWGIVLLLTILVAWWEIITGNHIVNLQGRLFTERNIATVNFYNPNNYSFFLSVGFPIILYWIERLRNAYKIIGFFMLISTFYIIYSNGSRISLIVLIIMLLIVLIKVVNNRKIIVLPMIVISIFSIMYFYDYIVHTALLLTVDAGDESLGIRSNLYESAINISYNYPFGVGPGKVEEFMPIIGSNVHNFWLEIMANYGFIVFLGLILFFGRTIYLFAQVRHDKELKPVLKPVLLSILIFIPTSIVPSSIFTFDITWFLFGVMLVCTNLIKKHKNSKKAQLYKLN